MERTLSGSSLPVMWPVMWVDRSLRMVFASREAFERCAQWNFGPRASELNPRHVFRVPAEIASACARLSATTQSPAVPKAALSKSALSKLAMSKSGVASAWVAHPGKAGLSARIEICLSIEEQNAPAGFFVQFVSAPTVSVVADARPQTHGELRALTPSERRVALLAANGLSNKSVARQLHKSERTVECQMSAIYRKLGLPPNRVQLSRLIAGSSSV
jgi:DNA-binding CsgD family transcriptional regulator